MHCGASSAVQCSVYSVVWCGRLHMVCDGVVCAVQCVQCGVVWSVAYGV